MRLHLNKLEGIFMKRLIIIVLSVVAISAVVAGGLIADHTHEEGALGHSGGTDSSGCHTNSKTGDYHCHNPK